VSIFLPISLYERICLLLLHSIDGTLGVQDFKAALASMGISGATEKVTSLLIANAAAAPADGSSLVQSSDNSTSRHAETPTSTQNEIVVSNSRFAGSGFFSLRMKAKAVQLNYELFAASLQLLASAPASTTS
jgi:hypothetical protein